MIQQDAIAIKRKKDTIKPKFCYPRFYNTCSFCKDALRSIDMLCTDAGKNYRGFVVIIAKEMEAGIDNPLFYGKISASCNNAIGII